MHLVSQIVKKLSFYNPRRKSLVAKSKQYLKQNNLGKYKDFADWVPMLKKGGVLCMHDANRNMFGNWGWNGPSKIAKQHIHKPYWVDIQKADSLLCAIKNF